ncbi:pyrroline-5-carboxylate reductase [Alkalitalea saponilacus]|uniref:Pyrroline-5-carboxylate reductase n=1 Tax=Alkalitalea saponilacus TaxID=889453 RepID=A0A1T5AMZ9_9BACT|nr:pyrroline-5-carboxylate reductase [Alkalitalea saponilacus]ASB48652.1 pyrroline-5-carboxylate reductase [Alkalitalea saponilacus]SKB36210.1 pyrroline-5-carboxylate reductase [Alkalitalea saponilacus]
MEKIAIIGGGNLGSAIARGLVHTKACDPQMIHVTRRRAQLLAPLAGFGVITGSNNLEAVKSAKIVFLAVKPYQMKDLLAEISPAIAGDAVLISLATGIDNKTLLELSGGKNAVFRAMPNTAVAIGQSMTCLASLNATPDQDEKVKALFEQLGTVQFIPEELMAGATVLAACGIAFALRFIRAATQGGIEIGFGSELALKIASQTVKGAAHLLIEGGTHPEAEIDKVTTPRGITISGLNEMEHQGFSSSLIKGLMASYQKIENGSKQQK